MSQAKMQSLLDRYRANPENTGYAWRNEALAALLAYALTATPAARSEVRGTVQKKEKMFPGSSRS